LQNVLVVNTGATKTQLTMVSGQRLLFEQQVDFGEDPLFAQISMALDAPPDVTREIVFRRGVHPTAEATAAPGGIDDTQSSNMILTIVRPQFSNLVAEIRRAVLFASSETRGGDVGRVYLMGSIAKWPGAADLLESLAEMPVSIPGPAVSSGVPGSRSEPLPELVIPSGLALRGFADA
jgi:Tfp pilus assembly PilM family ATPase